MKNFLSRVQDLSQKAAHLKAALETAPPKIAAIKDSVTATASQLGQLRGEIQEALSGLRTEGDASLARVLQEIDNHSPLFPKAGYLLETVESELGLVPRLIVRLRRIEEVPASTLRNLMTTAGLPACIQAILASMLKAAETADRAGLVALEYNRLTVTLGISPSMRVSWSPPTPSIPLAQSALTPPASGVATPLSPAVSAFPSALGEGSFFQPRAHREATAPAFTAPPLNTSADPLASGATAAEIPSALSSLPPATPSEASPSTPVSADPLARFKRMPNLSKTSGSRI